MSDLTEELAPEDWHDEHFKIDGLRSADWACRKLAQLRAAEAERAAYVAEVQAWKREQDQKQANSINYFESILRNYHEELLAEDPKKKTIALPSGKLKAYKNPDRVDVDAETFIPWARINRPELVRETTTYAAEKAAIKSLTLSEHNDKTYDEDSGEALPGVELVEGIVTYRIETNEA